MNVHPWLTTDRGTVVLVIEHPPLNGWDAKARAPASVNAKYFPDWLGLNP
jgi:hypothetical protein